MDRARLEQALIAADQAGDVQAARQLAAALRSPSPPPAQPAAPAQPSRGEGIARQVARTGRAIGQGVASAGDLIQQGIGLGDTPAPWSPVNILAEPFRQAGVKIPTPSGLVTQLTEHEMLEPQTRGERIADDVVRGGAAALVGTPGAGIARAGGGAVSKLLAASSPVRQAVAGSAAGGASGIAREAGVGQTGQAIAGLVAGGAVAPKAIGTKKPEFVTPPGHSRGVAKILEGIAGKQSVEDLASIKNQRVVNEKVRRVIGLGPKDEITPKALQSVREQAGEVYERVASAGEIVPDQVYAKQLASLLTESRKVGGVFKGANVGSTNQIQELVSSLWQPKFNAKSTVEYIKQLRDDAKSNLSQFNTDPQRRALGKAQQKASGILESQLERHLQSSGNGKLYGEYRNARELIAKTYTIEKALNPANGNVSALKLAKDVQKGKPLSGELRQIGEAATATPKAFKTLDNSRPGFSPLDVYGAGGLGGLGLAATGDPISLLAGAVVPLGRAAARNVLLNPPSARDIRAPLLGTMAQENSER